MTLPWSSHGVSFCSLSLSSDVILHAAIRHHHGSYFRADPLLPFDIPCIRHHDGCGPAAARAETLARAHVAMRGVKVQSGIVELYQSHKPRITSCPQPNHYPLITNPHFHNSTSISKSILDSLPSPDSFQIRGGTKDLGNCVRAHNAAMAKRKRAAKHKRWGRKYSNAEGLKGWRRSKASKKMRKTYHFTRGGTLKRGAGLNSLNI
jgi:hypothetical protein